jgi:microcystin-dependent protein
MPWFSPKTWFQNEKLKSADLNSYIRDNMIDLDARVVAASAAASPSGFIGYTGAAAAPTGWLLCDGSAVSRTTYLNLFNAVGIAFGGGDGSTTFNLPNLKGRVIVGLDSGQTEFDVRGETGGAKTVALAAAEMPIHAHTINEHVHGFATGGQSTSHWHGLGGHYHWVNGVGDHWHQTTRNDHAPPVIAIGSADALTQTNKSIQATSDAGHTTHTSDNGGHDHGNTQGPSGGSDGADRDHSHSGTTYGASDRGTNNQGGGVGHNNLQPYIVLNAIIKT